MRLVPYEDCNTCRCGAVEQTEVEEDGAKEGVIKNFYHIIVIQDDADEFYRPKDIHALLKEAERQGHSLNAGSYIEHLTVRQLDALVHGKTDA